MIKIDNPACYDGRTYGTIIKEDFEAARRVLSPETMLDWVQLALQRDGFEWKYPDCISRKGIKEMEQAGYLRPYGAEDLRFCTESPEGIEEEQEQNTNSAYYECDYQPITGSKAPLPDPNRIFKKRNTETNVPNVIPESTVLYEDEDDDLLF